MLECISSSCAAADVLGHKLVCSGRLAATSGSLYSCSANLTNLSGVIFSLTFNCLDVGNMYVEVVSI